MQMINVLKRLAELDATNPNVVPAKKLVKESTEVAECGPMGMMDGMSTAPSTPASLSVTAGSGEELGSMLAALMQLAGVHKVEPEHLGAEPQPSTMTSEPVMGADAERDSMRSVLDKMHDMGDEKEETDEGEYDNSPADPTKPPAVDTNQYAYRPNSGSAHGRATKNNPHGDPSKHEEEKKADMTMEAQLMDEYRNFVAEDSDRMINGKEIDMQSLEGNSVNVQAVYKIISRFDQNMNEIGGYGDPDYKAAVAALQQGDVETAIEAVVNSYGNQNGGEVRGIDPYIQDLQDEFEYLTQGMMEETAGEDDIDQFVNGNRPNFNGREEDDFDKAHQMFANFLKKKGLNVDEINDDAFPVLVAMCQGQPCAWYDLENAQGYVAK
jgi:hypothetical protein